MYIVMFYTRQTLGNRTWKLGKLSKFYFKQILLLFLSGSTLVLNSLCVCSSGVFDYSPFPHYLLKVSHLFLTVYLSLVYITPVFPFFCARLSCLLIEKSSVYSLWVSLCLINIPWSDYLDWPILLCTFAKFWIPCSTLIIKTTIDLESPPMWLCTIGSSVSPIW